MHRPAGVLGDVRGPEIVIVVLDLGPRHDVVAGAAEDLLDALIVRVTGCIPRLAASGSVTSTA